uniref:Nucleoprotein n=1 Tax=Evros bunya-like virus TaxID=2805760 RepID=A0A889INH1_9VIRU|nr:MAG: nucleocapsid [Evros bunya-like virus]
MVDDKTLRLKRCICASGSAKTRPDFSCNCLARVIKLGALKDFGIDICLITPDSVKKFNWLISKTLLERYYYQKRSAEITQRELEENTRKFQTRAPAKVIEKDPVKVTPTPTDKPTVSAKEAPAPVDTPLKDSSVSRKEETIGIMALKNLSWMEVMEKIVLESVTSDLDGFLTKHSEAFLTAYEYKGFDVEVIRKTLLERFSKMKAGTKLYICDKVEIELAGKEALSTAIQYLVALFNLRGNNLDAIADGLEREAKGSFNAIKTALGLQSKVKVAGKTKSADTLTLARIAAAFPIHSLRWVMRPECTRKVISMSDCGLSSSPLAKCLTHPVVPSVLTNSMIKVDKVVYITFLASFRLNQLIGGKEKATPDRLWLFHKAALSSKACTDGQKEDFWKTVDFEQVELRTAVELASELLENLLDYEVLKEIKDFME